MWKPRRKGGKSIAPFWLIGYPPGPLRGGGKGESVTRTMGAGLPISWRVGKERNQHSPFALPARCERKGGEKEECIRRISSSFANGTGNESREEGGGEEL